MAANPVRQFASEQLKHAPSKAVDANNPAHLGQTQSLLVEESRIEHPDKCVDKFLNQACLAQSRHTMVTPTHQFKERPSARFRRQTCQVAGSDSGHVSSSMAHALSRGPGKRLLHKKIRQHQSGDDHQQTENKKALPWPERGGHVAGDYSGNCHAHIAREFVQPDDQTALIGSRDVELRGLCHRPCKALIHS